MRQKSLPQRRESTKLGVSDQNTLLGELVTSAYGITLY
jgi:hypothetical protein